MKPCNVCGTPISEEGCNVKDTTDKVIYECKLAKVRRTYKKIYNKEKKSFDPIWEPIVSM